jgi:hypothetical protein
VDHAEPRLLDDVLHGRVGAKVAAGDASKSAVVLGDERLEGSLISGSQA